ncbi:MAG: ribonuclease HII [Bacteroidota bacterium]
MPDLVLERRHWEAGRRFVVGTDEAGRGCLAGPVVAAAVVLAPTTDERDWAGLTDSKKLSPDQRSALLPEIEHRAVAVGVGLCSPAEIDTLNILWASLEAMRRAVAALPCCEALLVDGNRAIPDAPWPQTPLVKGDGRSLSIAAASVVAKVTRDRIMTHLHDDYPMYGWAQHKGYPTKAHYDALAAYGPCRHHRQSFRLQRR